MQTYRGIDRCHRREAITRSYGQAATRSGTRRTRRFLVTTDTGGLRPALPIGRNPTMTTAIFIALAVLGIAEIFNHNIRSM
jgi:hypothetical protein